MITKFYISDPDTDIVEEHSVLEMTEEELHNLIYYAYPSWCKIVKVEEVDYTMDEMHEELHQQLALRYAPKIAKLRIPPELFYNKYCKFCKEEELKDKEEEP